MNSIKIIEPEVIEIETTRIVIDHNTSRLAKTLARLKSIDYTKDETIEIFTKVFSIFQSFGLIFFLLDAALITVQDYDVEIFTYLPLAAHALICKTAIICAIFTGCNALFNLYKNIIYRPKFDRKTIINNSFEIVLLIIALIYTIISAFVQLKTNPIYLYDSELFYNGNTYNKEGLLTVLMYAMIFLTAFTLRNEKHRQYVIAAVFINGYAAIITMIIMAATNSNATNDFIAYRLVSGIFNNSNHFGYFTCVLATLSAASIVFSKKFWHVIFGTAFLVPSLLCLLVSKTLGSNLGFVAGIIFIVIAYIVKNKKFSAKILWLIIVSAIVFAISESTKFTNMVQDYKNLAASINKIIAGTEGGDIESTYSAGSGRWGLWIGTLKCCGESPWIGKGLDCYYGYNFIDSTLDMPHNEYIQIASNVGIPVMVFYVCTFIVMYVRAIIYRKQLSNTTLISLAVTIAYLVSAFFGNTFIYTYPYFLIFFAFAIPKTKKVEEVPEDTHTYEYV